MLCVRPVKVLTPVPRVVVLVLSRVALAVEKTLLAEYHSLILLRSAALILGKKLAARMSAFIELLSVRGSLIDLLRSSKWGSAFAILAFLLYFNRI